MPVLQYSLEYKVPGLPWEEAEVIQTNKTHMLFLKYADTYIYEVRVSARNIFGLGSATEVMKVYFAGM